MGRGLTANKPSNDEDEKDGAPDMGSDKYTLLMYLANIVNTQYPELSDWAKIFENCKACIKIKPDELEKDVNSIDKRVKNLRVQLKRMDEERAKFQESEKKKLK